MAPESSHSHETRPTKRRKLAPPPFNTNNQRTTTSSSKPTPTSQSTLESHISPRRRWRSNAPRAQHAWQKSARANAESESGTELERVYALLCLIVRRNRNQHRQQGWWRWLIGLRRSVGRVVQLSVGKGGVGEGWEEGSEAVRRRLQREAEVGVQKQAVEDFVRLVLLERCYGAFSSVVRDVQFAALGVVLMGVLARVGREVGLPEREVREVGVVKGVSLRQTGVDQGVVVRREWRSGGVDTETETTVVSRDGDHGEGREESEIVKDSEIEEEKVGGDEEIREVSREIRRADSVIASSSRTGKGKKKKGKKSAIDDLFAGLV